jgi:hypothetical protein
MSVPPLPVSRIGYLALAIGITNIISATSGIARGAPVATHKRAEGKDVSTCVTLPSPRLSRHVGSIAGHLRLSGGPKPGISRCSKVTGRVTLSDLAHHSVTSAKVTTGAFRLVVHPGTYTLTASAANRPCASQTVIVVAARQKMVNITCSIP